MFSNKTLYILYATCSQLFSNIYTNHQKLKQYLTTLPNAKYWHTVPELGNFICFQRCQITGRHHKFGCPYAERATYIIRNPTWSLIQGYATVSIMENLVVDVCVKHYLDDYVLISVTSKIKTFDTKWRESTKDIFYIKFI